jgi:hypothetical protein
MFGSIASGLGLTVPQLGAAGGGLLGFIGQQQTNQKNWDIAQAANQASAEQAQRQMDFQERMRATQYQTAIEDMKKAGLNPILAYSQGGAGTPSGAMGQVSTAKVGNAIGSALAGAQAASMTAADVDLKEATTTNTSAQTLKIEADTIQTAANIGKILEDTKVSTQTYKNLQEQLNKLLEEINLVKATTKQTSAQTGKTTAEEKNIRENVAPSVDPFWYRDIKKNFPTPTNVENFIKRKYQQYKGKK